MGETDRLLVLESQNQSGVIEILLGEDQLLENIGRNGLQQSELLGAAAPDRREDRRIGIAKRTKAYHFHQGEL